MITTLESCLTTPQRLGTPLSSPKGTMWCLFDPTPSDWCKTNAHSTNLAQYKEEGWNDPIIPEEESIDYEYPDLEQLLGVIECKVGKLMEKAISLMGRSESVFGMSSNIMRQLPPEPSRQEAFEDLVMNFILDQEERVKQLKRVYGNNRK
nr:hypothetical protein [Tanacetum cinerariifolium]